MTKLKEERLDAVIKMIKSYGIYYDDCILMSLHEIASDLNNTWKAYLFVDRAKIKVAQTYGTSLIGQSYFSIGSWQLQKLFRGIRHAVKDTDLTLVNPGSYRTEYIIFKELNENT